MSTLSEQIAGLTDGERKLFKYLGIIGFIPTLFWGGFVTMILWRWFMVPLGLIEIGMAHALGVSCLVAWARSGNAVKNEMEQEKDRIPVFLVELGTWVMGIMVLGFGWIYTLFM